MTARRWRAGLAVLFATYFVVMQAALDWMFDMESSTSARALTLRLVFALGFGWAMTTVLFRTWPGWAGVPAKDRWEVIYATERGRPAPQGLEQKVIDFARYLQDEIRRMDGIRWHHWLVPAGLIVAGGVLAIPDGVGTRSMTVWAAAVVAAILVALRPPVTRRRAARAQRAETLATEMLLH